MTTKEKDASFARICNKLETSTTSLSQVCASQASRQKDTLSYSEFKKYINPASLHYDKEKASRFTQALGEQKIFLAECILAMSDELWQLTMGNGATSVMAQVLKLRTDAIKWYLKNMEAGAGKTDGSDTAIQMKLL